MNAEEQISGLHAIYCAMTGFNLVLHTGRVHEWHYWIKRGWTKADLQCVIAHIWRGIKKGERNMGALKFSNLIGDLDRFEEDLAMARALVRKPVSDSARASVLRATSRSSEPPSKDSVPMATVIAGLKKAVGLPPSP
jgi:hypothetical protein